MSTDLQSIPSEFAFENLDGEKLLHIKHTMINEQISLLHTEMTIVAEVIKSRNHAGFNEYGPLLEAFTKHAMRLVTGREFANLNRIKVNHKAIDLCSNDGTILIQVTSTADSNKIRETVRKFEEKDKDTGKSISDDYPNLEKLYIFGFCKNSDSSKLKTAIPAYCESIGRNYFSEQLTEESSAKLVFELRNKLRNMSYFNEVRTLTDDACIEIMRQFIDRNAINHSILAEGSYHAMTKSLQELSYFINTGKNPDNDQVCKARWDFGSDKYRNYLDSVFSEISKILAICNAARVPRDSDNLNLTYPDKLSIDDSKQAIKTLTSAIFKKA